MNLRDVALSIYGKAVDAVRPDFLEKRVQLIGDLLSVDRHMIDVSGVKRFFVFGSGKAAIPMARAMEKSLGKQLAGGLVVSNYDDGSLGKIRVMTGSHPVPDERSLAGGAALKAELGALEEGDFFLYLLSGGSSALIEDLKEPLTLEDLQQTTRLMLGAGMPIREMNCVRKHLSALKGGQLAAGCKARGAVLMISDVIGDDTASIGSGPLYGDRTTFGDARRYLEEHKIWSELPAPVRTLFEEGIAGKVPETPEPEACPYPHYLVAGNRKALFAAKKEAERLGFPAVVMTSSLEGEAEEAAKAVAALGRECARYGEPFAPPVCLLFGGETTVTLRGNGKGGRNQQLALAALEPVAELADVLLLAAGTDGIDGVTDAAGAMVDAGVLERARQQGLDPVQYLENNDAYPFFQACDALVTTGPSGTNVMDVTMVLIDKTESI